MSLLDLLLGVPVGLVGEAADRLEDAITSARRSVHWLLPTLVEGPVRDVLASGGGVSTDLAVAYKSSDLETTVKTRPARATIPWSLMLNATGCTTIVVYGLPARLTAELLLFQVLLFESTKEPVFTWGDAVNFLAVPAEGVQVDEETGRATRYAILNFATAEMARQAKHVWKNKQFALRNLSPDTHMVQTEYALVQGLPANVARYPEGIAVDAGIGWPTLPSKNANAKQKWSPSLPPISTSDVSCAPPDYGFLSSANLAATSIAKRAPAKQAGGRCTPDPIAEGCADIAPPFVVELERLGM